MAPSRSPAPSEPAAPREPAPAPLLDRPRPPRLRRRLGAPVPAGVPGVVPDRTAEPSLSGTVPPSGGDARLRPSVGAGCRGTVGRDGAVLIHLVSSSRSVRGSATVERTWGRTLGVAPTCGAAAVLVVRARPQSVGTAAHWVARVIAHPIRPSPALAFPRSRLSGVPGPGGRRFARLLDDVDLARAPHGKLRSASRSVVSITAGSPQAGKEAKSGADIARLLRTLSSIWGSP